MAVEAARRVGLIGHGGRRDRVPEELEPVLAPEGGSASAELVEEELLLTLPIVPLHEEGTTCAVSRRTRWSPMSAGEETQKPFEQLGELLKRN